MQGDVNFTVDLFRESGLPSAAQGFWERILARQSRDRGNPEWMRALLLLLIDVDCWIGIYNFVSWARGGTELFSRFEFALLGAVQIAVILQALYIIGGYDWRIEMRSLSYAAEHFLALVAAAVFTSFLIYSAAAFEQTMKPSRGVLLLSFLIFAPLSLLYRRCIYTFVASTTSNNAFLVIGTGEMAARFYEAYKNSSNSQQLRFIDVRNERTGLPISGDSSPLIEANYEETLHNHNVTYSGIVVAEEMKCLPAELLEHLVRAQFHQTRVYTLESFYETYWRYVPLEVIDPVWPLQTGFQLARMSPYHYLKRLCDIIVSACALVLIGPALMLIALLIWLVDGRPIWFSQPRVGREEVPFTIHKFRTMAPRDDADADDIYTREGDPRVTRLGGWLRRLRLDELPQFWNVLKGDMSLIGPRAEWVRCAERYENDIPLYHFRHLVKPGITGWAQVNYPYGESDRDAIEKLKYDLYYIRHYSLKLDAMIALKTIHIMLFGKGR